MASDRRQAALSAAEVFCEPRVADEYRDERWFECSHRGNSITIVVRRPPWNPKPIGTDWTSTKVAKLRYDASSERWTLCCRERNERWWRYDGIGPSASVDSLWAEIDADPTGIFWG